MSAKMSEAIAEMGKPTARMPLVDISTLNDPELDSIIEKSRRLSTPKPAWYQTLASNPAVAKSFAQYWDTVFRGGRVEHEIKELMRNCVAQLLGCSFCSTQRSTQAVEEGLSEQTHRNVRAAPISTTRARACAPRFVSPGSWRSTMPPRIRRASMLYTPELHDVFDNEEIMELAGICVLFVGGHSPRTQPWHRSDLSQSKRGPDFVFQIGIPGSGSSLNTATGGKPAQR
jgi:alkylhydroperoxidase family enzyme